MFVESEVFMVFFMHFFTGFQEMNDIIFLVVGFLKSPERISVSFFLRRLEETVN